MAYRVPASSEIRRFFLIALLVAFAAKTGCAVTLAQAQSLPTVPQTIAQDSCNSSFRQLTPRDQTTIMYKSYMENCEQIRENWEKPQSSAPNQSVAHVTGLCADDTYTTAILQSNACTVDGGVAVWFVGNYTPPAPETEPPACAGGNCEKQHAKPAAPPATSKPKAPIQSPAGPIS